MQGDLADLPLLGVLELLHFCRKTGVLEVDAPLPFALTFVGGEVVEGGLLDWAGLDAVCSLPLTPSEGRFHFKSGERGGPVLRPFARLMGDWAHAADEWRRVCAVLGSPSRVLCAAVSGTAHESASEYAGGRSVRAVARHAGEPLFDVARRAADLTLRGELEVTDRFAWHVLRLRHPRSRTPDALPPGSPERLLDGQLNLGELIERGQAPHDLRAFLLREIRAGLRFPGAGWVLRDLAWEAEALAAPQLAPA